MTATLELKGVVKRFGPAEIIRGVDLRVLRGERHALIGPNGAGKSTLFHLVSGHLRLSGGEIRLGGTRLDGRSPAAIARLGLARSFQITSIFGGMSVFENLRLAVLARRRRATVAWRLASAMTDAAEEAVARAEAVRLRPRLDTPAADLAYAEQRALELALTLALDPGVVLLDEPTAGMSAEEAAATVDLIRRTTEGRTLLVVEHDMDIVFRLCDRISVLVNGRVVATDAPAAIASNPDVRTAYLGDAVDA
ncbi:ATP-binding cassette domain-containing protein [Siccirubricoccus sp. KC 17139]|uniref:ATP-binding cassette domain-containing protein n=1 Tax=Siccirubricoccus soli TaxID=2899147 RepID=A0ABT1D3R5_9PROT|nr:ATP-binding cassette domain-containing protein [Siccirubricoccus soli]MCO6416561.1 ATP-binding cassette domain-containing protein [Siccirubricoccus soli]MCP2682696.1 ATP-binding cassette domain-containing protein [Siccirubricoccus soli]